MEMLEGSLNKNSVQRLICGQEILFSGTVYTARDQAHRKLVTLIKKRKKLPFKLKNQVIYYCGPPATPQGKIIGSCGPTTSLRMDEFVESLLEVGLLGMIGKGRRSTKVISVIRKHKAIYFIAPAGCGALLSKKL